jgi:hypothetical protein
MTFEETPNNQKNLTSPGLEKEKSSTVTPITSEFYYPSDTPSPYIGTSI